MAALKVGDKVIIYRKVKKTYWLDTMDRLVGKTGVIVDKKYEEEPNEDSFLIEIQGEPFRYYIPKTAVKRYKD